MLIYPILFHIICIYQPDIIPQAWVFFKQLISSAQDQHLGIKGMASKHGLPHGSFAWAARMHPKARWILIWGKPGEKSGDWWCPSRFITPIAMVFVGDISIVNGINQLVTWGAPPCRCVQVTPISRWFMVDILTYWHTMVYKPTFHH